MNKKLIKGLSPFWKKCFVLSLLLSFCQIYAQPSGGPYGPIKQIYELPTANTIYFVSPQGNDEAAGTELNQPTTLESAIARVISGDAIILRGGTYRTGDLVFNQGITIQPYKDEEPILKGTKIVSKGIPLWGKNVWRIPWKTFFPSKPLKWWWRDHAGLTTPLHRFNNDMVFADGRFLQSVGWEGEVDSNSYYIDYENEQVYVGVDPAKHLVEITAYSSAFVRNSSEVHGKVSDKIGPTIKGITITQYAWRGIEIEGKRKFGPMDEPTDEPLGPSDPATYGKEVIGTTLENVTITYCSRVAGYFRGDSLTIRQSHFANTSTEGVYVIGSSDVLLEGNIFGRNNIENLVGYYPSAVKIFNQSHRVTCRNNLVLDNPNSSGIWYDVGNEDGVFVNNWVQGCENGFFFEISKGATVVGNVFLNCVNGTFVLNSSNVKVWNNTYINSSARFARDNRQAGGHFGWHAATAADVDKRHGHVFANNLSVANESFSGYMFQTIQSKDLCGKLTGSMMMMLNGNVYSKDKVTSTPMFIWNPSEEDGCSTEFDDIKTFQNFNSEFETNGKILNSNMSSIFKSSILKNYELNKPVQETYKIVPMPENIKKLVGWDDIDITSPGAYQTTK